MLNKKILDDFKNKKALITGGTGLIGRQVADILIKAGCRVIIVSLDKININKNAEHITGDLASFEFCKKITKNTDFVFHLAGVKASIEASKSHIASHFVPTLMMNTNILEACKLNNVAKTVYTSSIGAYANEEIYKECNYRVDSMPMDFAGWAKRMAELQIQAYKSQYNLENFAVVRPANVYGPGDNYEPKSSMVIPSIMYRIFKKENPVIIWGDGSQIRDFVFSKDAAKGIILALYHGTGSGFVNIGGGRGYSIRELVETLHSFIDFNYEFDTSKPSGLARKILDISMAEKTIGYKPETSLYNGLKQTWEWLAENHDEYRNLFNYFSG